MSLLYFEIFQRDERTVPITERALAYGDGLFTTAKISYGKIELIDEHINRLRQGAQRLGIKVSLNGLVERLGAIASEYEIAVLKVVISAGEGGRGYSRINSCSQKILISVHPFPEYYFDWQQNGISLGVAKTAIGINPLLAGLKHLNRLEQIIVRQELDARPEDDLVVTDCQGNVIEVSAGNLFWLHLNSKTWQTPALDSAGVNGLIRQNLVEQLDSVEEITVQIGGLVNARSMFICNSVMGVVPIKTYLDKPLDVAPVMQLKKHFEL
ncbi:aminodeoxychorismate lyase [Thalassotalea sp. M1531]|uniref:Aminodeoxychorismate lyase n=1 Tax=Thalassotalea algicola TaxID=2716224 RepID=A0A7Y0LC22_9GAMM|nr:aminodeoxychorismate lyase [Thalassotalea algicola]NMP31418.1 aminodeoxychorismate lyase [Thalassotalea algicola]